MAGKKKYRPHGFGSIRKRGKYWTLQVRNREGKIVTQRLIDPDSGTPVATKAQAERVAPLAAAKIRNEKPQHPDDFRLIKLEALDEEYKAAFSHAWSEKRRSARRQVMRIFKEWFPTVGDVTHRRLGEYQHYRLSTPTEKTKRPPTQATLNRELAALRRLLNWARETQMIPYNPMDGFVFGQEDNERDRILNAEERKLFLRTALLPEFEPIRLILYMGFFCGLRKGTILSRKRTDVVVLRKAQKDGEKDIRGFVLQKTKRTKLGKRLRNRDIRVPFPPQVDEELESHLQREPMSEWLFPSPVDPSQPREDFRKLWRRFKQECGLENFRFHDTRHCAATLMAEAGVHPKVMQDYFDWSSMKMAERYCNLAEQAKIDAITQVARNVQRSLED